MLGCASRGRAAGDEASTAVASSGRKLRRIGLELYTVRRELAQDLPGTLKRVAEIGYKEVEFAGYANRTPTEIRDLLQVNGLTAPSTHIGLPAIQREPQKTFDDAKTIGHEWVTVASLSGRQTTVDDWKRVADSFNQAGRAARTAGLRFSYHNHNTEFRPIKDSAVKPYDILLAETDPSVVDFQMDLYWVVNAGASPLDYIARYPGRFTMLHVKDSMGPPDHKMADVGAGMIDFRTIFARAGASVKHYFVEHDDPPDPFASAAASYRYLATLEF